MKWEDIVWYHLKPGNKNAVTCYSCRKPISTKEPRVVTNIIRKCSTDSYLPCNLSFHASFECLQDRLYHERGGGRRNNLLIPFDGKVAVDPSLWQVKEKYKDIAHELERNGIKVLFQSPVPLHDESQGTII
jgi:hypothetical protein